MNSDNHTVSQPSPSNLDGSLSAIASQTSLSINAQYCSILLFGESDRGLLRVSYCANFPHSSDSRVTPLEQAIATYIAQTGQPLLIQNGKSVPFTLPKSNLTAVTSTSSISVPLYQNGQIIGTIVVTHPLQKKYFEEADLDLLKLFAKVASQSLHIAHLQNILKSKFVTLAVARESQETQEIDPHPTKLARIVAKSFFRELTQAGFHPPQIIEIATEVLSLLHITLDKHRQRLSRDD